MFAYNRAITNIDALADWNTGSVTNMSQMFYEARALVNSSAINGWDIRAVTATAGSSTSSSNKFYRMFYNAPSHPEFTMRTGTWNSEGTFIPSETPANNNNNANTPSQANSITPTNSITQNNTATTNTDNDNTNNVGSSYTTPQGVSRIIDDNSNSIEVDNSLNTGLIITATVSASTSGALIIFALARRRDDDEDEEDS